MEGGGGIMELAKEAAAAVALAAANEGAPPPDPERKYRGVRRRRWGTYSAEIRDVESCSGRKKLKFWLGSHATAVEAACAYDAAVRTLRPHGGARAKTNFPEPPETTEKEKARRAAVVLAHVDEIKRKRAEAEAEAAMAAEDSAVVPPSPPAPAATEQGDASGSEAAAPAPAGEASTARLSQPTRKKVRGEASFKKKRATKNSKTAAAEHVVPTSSAPPAPAPAGGAFVSESSILAQAASQSAQGAFHPEPASPAASAAANAMVSAPSSPPAPAPTRESLELRQAALISVAQLLAHWNLQRMHPSYLVAVSAAAGPTSTTFSYLQPPLPLAIDNPPKGPHVFPTSLYWPPPLVATAGSSLEPLPARRSAFQPFSDNPPQPSSGRERIRPTRPRLPPQHRICDCMVAATLARTQED